VLYTRYNDRKVDREFTKKIDGYGLFEVKEHVIAEYCVDLRVPGSVLNNCLRLYLVRFTQYNRICV